MKYKLIRVPVRVPILTGATGKLKRKEIALKGWETRRLKNKRRKPNGDKSIRPRLRAPR